ncbi:MAG TPA: cell division protein FtsQ/DivIB [Woeseiaceae bacterium]|nr:cell division protein FtsQ/DivIB [Woeseiaceae bacterium]
MARKQARRRKQPRARSFRMPTIRIARFIAPLVAVFVVVATYEASSRLLDREIASIEISGPFQRVTALQIEEVISGELDAGFLGADLGHIRNLVRALPWIDEAAVARRWPNRIAITVTEQVPAAIWGDSGLLNVRGELFVDSVRHVPAELPHLSGPKNHSAEVARRYLHIREQLIPIGLNVRSVRLDERGSWDMTLTNGVEVHLGRRDVDKRSELFIDIVANLITGRAADIDHVDMRYSNGFTVGWKDGAGTPTTSPETMEQEMLALRDTR